MTTTEPSNDTTEMTPEDHAAHVSNTFEEATADRNRFLNTTGALTAERDRLQDALDRLRVTLDEAITDRDRFSAAVDELLNRNTTLAADHDLLTERLSHAVAEQEQAARELASMTTQRDRSVAGWTNARLELTAFKEQVVEVATRYANENDWCSVVDRALEELGLERAKKQYRGTLTITVEFEATLDSDHQEVPDRGWVRDSITLDTDAIRGALEFDSDHEEGSVTDVSFSYSNIRDND